MDIKHETNDGKGAFSIEIGGERLATMTYTMAGTGRMLIDHTEVDDKLRGTGAGKKLVAAGAEFARLHGIRIIPVCPFAKAVMERNESDYADVLE